MTATKPETKKAAALRERDESIATILGVVQPGDTIYTILRRVSASGMHRHIGVIAIKNNEPRDITFHAGRALGLTLDRDTWGLKVSGCGMDMGFHVVYKLGHRLWPEGTNTPSQGHRTGGYSIHHRWL